MAVEIMGPDGGFFGEGEGGELVWGALFGEISRRDEAKGDGVVEGADVELVVAAFVVEGEAGAVEVIGGDGVDPAGGVGGVG